MCNEIARRQDLQTLVEDFGQLIDLPPFRWWEDKIPNDLAAKDSVRIGDPSLVVRLRDDHLEGQMLPWAWKSPNGKPVFNFVSEGRDFSKSDRVLVFADGFYEFTAPENPKLKLKNKHLFEMIGQPWFWIAGIVRENAFTLLTTAPGPDLIPYHDRQIVTLAPSAGMDWLNLSQTEAEIFRLPPAGTFNVTTIRRGGEPAAQGSLF